MSPKNTFDDVVFLASRLPWWLGVTCALLWDFEFLVAEYFRRLGFRVEETGKGADGGYDLIAVKDREKFLVQCKQWRVDTAGVKIVRELSGVVTAEQASGGIVVTSGKFSKEALAFARANKIMLIAGKELHGNIRWHAGIEEGPDSLKNRSSRKFLWTCAVLLLFVLGGAMLLFTEPGRMAHSSFSAMMTELTAASPERQDPGQNRENRSIRQPQEKNLVFGVEQVRQTMKEVLRNTSRQAEKTDGENIAEPVLYRYEIELHSGGWIFANNAEITDRTITYTGRRGLVVSLERGEVRSMKRVRVEKK